MPALAACFGRGYFSEPVGTDQNGHPPPRAAKQIVARAVVPLPPSRTSRAAWPQIASLLPPP